jgi:hypothetical protein
MPLFLEEVRCWELITPGNSNVLIAYLNAATTGVI